MPAHDRRCTDRLSAYDDLVAIGAVDIERRRDVWSDIVEVQDRITVLLPPP
jgi:hypothetical protein